MESRDMDGSIQCNAEFSHLAIEATRLRTFLDWPKALKQTPEQLSDAGFFYTKIGDRVVCFNCGIGLRGWEVDDDPWEEHIRFSEDCEYVQLVKGKLFIEDVKKRKSLALKQNISMKEKADPPSHIDTPPENETEKCCEKWDEKLHEWIQCKICFLNEINTVFAPCGHMIACAKCASTLTECPTCRERFREIIRVYLS